MFFDLRGGAGGNTIQNFPNFKCSPKLGTRGAGSSNLQFFPNSKKSPKPPGGGGGQENYGLFHFLGHFLIQWLP